ncbi:hypothetical protein L7F22_066950 [Adiantum nelumboides]|nr:hypothetical protein [Adiantum nelumboides]
MAGGDQRVSSAPAEYDLKQLLLEAPTRWLKPAEICQILNNHQQLALSEASPVKPTSGSLFLFDRNKLRYFRKDGHNWRKKRDGRTVREAHEKLKAGNKDAIHCYYAHGEDNPSFQRRSYWLLEGGYENIVLVHYREVTEGSRLEASPRTFDENCLQIYPQIQSTNLMYGNTDYLSSSFISSPSEVISSSHNSQEGLVDVDSSDDFGENQGLRESISQAFQASFLEKSLGLDSTACTRYAPSSVAPDANSMVLAGTSSNTVVNDVSQFGHQLQFQTAANRDPYGQGTTNKNLEDGLPALPWPSLLESTYSDRDAGNWRGFQPSQQLAGPDFTTGSYNNQFALRDSGEYMGQGVRSNEAWSLDLENQSDIEYAAAVREPFRTKAGEQYMEPNVLLMDPLKEKEQVSSNKQELQTKSEGLLSPTVSLFMQSIQSDLAIPFGGTSWGNISKIQHEVSNVSSLPGQFYNTAPALLFNILEFAPEWSYTSGKTKVLVIGVFLDPARNYSSTKWSCKFGEVEVSADLLQPGILRCTTPSHVQGRVSFCVTCNDGVSCSNMKEFEFRERSFVESSDKSFTTARKLETGRDMKQKEQAILHQIRFAKFLLTREDKASALEHPNDPPTAQKQNEKLDLLVVDGNNWSQMESLVRGDQHPYEDAKVMLGEAFLKFALYQWLQRKCNRESLTALDEHGLGVLHMAAALGYEWAIAPLLAAGVGVNTRDGRGWTALHWAAFCGREKVIALLLAADASPGALTDPTPSDSTGRTASDLAASSGHDGIAGYLGEAIVTSHFTSLNLRELSKLSVAVGYDQAVEVMSERSTVVDASLGVDDLSLKDSLAAVRNAAQAEACITATFRAYSFHKKNRKEGSVLDEFGMLKEEARAFAAAQSNSRRYSALEKSNLAATQIQCKYRGWKVRNDFLSLKKHVVRIQAHVRGHQARKKYKKILWTVSILDKVILRWRRRGSGLRGYKADGIQDEDSDDDAYLKDFRKQKEAAFGEAVGRVKQMIQNPEARTQYRRMLENYQKEKGAQLDDDLIIFDDDELMGLLG